MFSLEKMKQKQCLTAAYSCLMGERKKVETLLEVPRDRMTGKEHRLEPEKNAT